MQVRVLPGSSTHVTWLRCCGNAAFPNARLLSAFSDLCGLAFWFFVSQIAFYTPTPYATKKKKTASREHAQLHWPSSVPQERCGIMSCDVVCFFLIAHQRFGPACVLKRIGVQGQLSRGLGSHKPPVGFEPTTSRLLSGCSAS